MRLAVALVASCLAKTRGDDEKTFKPASVDFSTLADTYAFVESDSAVIMDDALTSAGLIAVSGIPKYASLRRDILTASYLCSKESDATVESTFSDGTVRRSLASVTTEGKSEPVYLGQAPPKACAEFQDKEASFRQLVNDVSKKFSSALGRLYGDFAMGPLLWTPGEEQLYETVESVVDAGDHLEHFHAYYPTEKEDPSSSVTLDMHVDQGFFIVFTPAMMVDAASGSPTGHPTGEFSLQLSTGPVTVDFDDDTLVFMMGDAVNHIINSKLPPGKKSLAAASHSLSLNLPESSSSSEVRVWHGRMVIPPSDTVHESFGVTHGKLRDMAIEASADEGTDISSLSLGCSRNLMEMGMEEMACADNQMYCWMRCMNESETVNPETCQALGNGYDMLCVDMFDQVYRPGIDTHGDYTLECSNSTANVTVSPTMAPADADACTTEKAKQSDVGALFDNNQTLKEDVYLYWTIVGESVKFRMEYYGNFGWLAMGMYNKAEAGSHPGMNGAYIVLSGRQRELPPNSEETLLTPAVYQIAEDKSAFRWWNDTRNTSVLTNTSIETADCSVAMEFIIPFSEGLNKTGANKMIFALHPTTTYMGYHGFMNKGVFDLYITPEPEENAGGSCGGSCGSGGEFNSATFVSRVSFVAAITPLLFSLYYH